MINIKYGIGEFLSNPIKKILIVIMMSSIFSYMIPSIFILNQYYQKAADTTVTKIGNRILYKFNNNGENISVEDGYNLIHLIERKTNKKFIFFSKTPEYGGFISRDMYHFPLSGDTLKLNSDGGEALGTPEMIEVNSQFMKYNEIKMDEGKTFDKNDFDGDESSIILGQSYSGHYSIGDTLSLGYFDEDYLNGKKDTLKMKNYIVKGIAASQTFINYNSPEGVSHDQLDKFIVIPNKSTVKHNRFFLSDFYIYLDEAEYKLAESIIGENPLSIGNIRLVESEMMVQASLESMRYQLVNNTIYLIFYLIFVMVSFIIVFSQIIKSRYTIYYIYMSIGSTKKDIISINFISLFLLTLFSLFLSLVYLNLQNISISVLSVVVGFVLIFIIFSILLYAILKKIKQSEIITYLKGVHS